MFDFEEDNEMLPKRKKIEDYDLPFGIAMSRSLLDTRESIVLSPEEIQKNVQTLINELIEFYQKNKN